jgi:hypothetical protein
MHLRNCVACRATLRDYRDLPRRAAYGLPLGMVVLSGEAGVRSNGLLQRVSDACESAYANVQGWLFGHAETIQHGSEVATAKKIAAIAAATATLVVGGTAMRQVHSDSTDGSRHRRSAAPVFRPESTPPSVASQRNRSHGNATVDRTRGRRTARSASAADVRRAIRGINSDAESNIDSPQGQSAGDSGEFNPQPQSVAPDNGGTSDPETDFAP